MTAKHLASLSMFNEEENIKRAVHFADAVLIDITSGYEILVVNDASTDRSAEIAEALAQSNSCVKMFWDSPAIRHRASDK